MSVISSASEHLLAILRGPHTGVLTTLFPDGSPQSTPVWFLRDGDHILFSTTAGKQKLRNVDHDPRATLRANISRWDSGHRVGNGRHDTSLPAKSC